MLFLRDTPRGLSWLVHLSPQSLTGRESLRCGPLICMLWHMLETKTAELSLERTSSPLKTMPFVGARRPPGWKWVWYIQCLMQHVRRNHTCGFSPTEGHICQISCPIDLIWVDYHWHGGPWFHWLGLPSGGWGPSTEKQPVQGNKRFIKQKATFWQHMVNSFYLLIYFVVFPGLEQLSSAAQTAAYWNTSSEQPGGAFPPA